MPLYDYRCEQCGRVDADVLAHCEDARTCESCGASMARPPARFGMAVAGPNRRTSGAVDTEMWGAEHVAALRSGDVEATREVHYEVCRRSGISRDRAREITGSSAEQGVDKTVEHARTVEAQPGGASAQPAAKVVVDA